MKKLIVIISFFTVIKTYGQEVGRPGAHAPIGVMGDHTHGRGEVMFSYRFMTMKMKDNRIATDDISADEIVTTMPNRFAGMGMQPPTLRVVPDEMTMNMHMLGVMYAPTDKLTLMGMAMIISNSMDLITYQGGMGTEVLGGFNTESSGFGDVKITAMYKFSNKVHVNLGVGIPTGSIEEEGQVLAPMGDRVTMRLPYPMQIGSGTWELLPAITHTTKAGAAGFGIQASGVVRLGENDNHYAFGDRLDVTTWGSYLITNWLSGSLRLAYFTAGEINGIDPDIIAPVQTADPAFHGGSRVDAFAGLNAIGQSGFVRNQRLAVEFGLPIFQDLNGPQMKVSSMLTLGWQYAF